MVGGAGTLRAIAQSSGVLQCTGKVGCVGGFSGHEGRADSSLCTEEGDRMEIGLENLEASHDGLRKEPRD